MIQITCTKCRTLLTIDDAFAGGVCRCQHCGTIQTVPSNLKGSARPKAPGAGSLPGSKTLYQKRAHTDAGTGLDDLASAVASSGLRAGHLRTATATAAKEKTASVATDEKKALPVLWLIIGGVLVLVLIIVGIIIVTMHSGAPANTVNPVASGSGSPDGGTGSAVTPTGSSFCGVPLADSSVVYILDRGSASGRYFDAMKAALYRSLELIGPKRQFAVILCDNQTSTVRYPATGLADADPKSVAAVQKLLDDEVATGSTQMRSSIEDAVGRSPAVIAIITGKYNLSDDDVAALKQNAQRGIPLDTFIVGDNPSADALKDIAGRSGGIFRKLTENELRQFGS
jgi:hypothetical protein